MEIVTLSVKSEQGVIHVHAVLLVTEQLTSLSCTQAHVHRDGGQLSPPFLDRKVRRLLDLLLVE